MQYNANPNPPQRSRKSGGKWGWIVLIIVAVILFRSGLVRRIIDGVQNFGESLFSFDLSVESEAPKPDAPPPRVQSQTTAPTLGQSPASGTPPYAKARQAPPVRSMLSTKAAAPIHFLHHRKKKAS